MVTQIPVMTKMIVTCFWYKPDINNLNFILSKSMKS